MESLGVIEESTPAAIPSGLVVIRNPVSTNHKRVQGQIADLQTQFPVSCIDVYPTLHDPTASPGQNRQANQERVLDILQERVDANNAHPDRPRQWLVIATGDGTIRDIAEAMLMADDAIRAVPILPLAGGNGNDVSSMLHGFWGVHNPAGRLPKARIETIHPLEAHFKNGTSRHTKSALGYITVGNLIAGGAREIDQNRNHNPLVRSIREKYLVLRGIAKAGPFAMVEGSVNRMSSDHIFVNGTRMAKAFRWPGNNLHDPQFARTELPGKTFFHQIGMAIRLAGGQAPYAVTPDGKQASLTVKSDTMVQLDGEAFDVSAGTTITIERSARSLNLVHLR